MAANSETIRISVDLSNEQYFSLRDFVMESQRKDRESGRDMKYPSHMVFLREAISEKLEREALAMRKSRGVVK